MSTLLTKALTTALGAITFLSIPLTAIATPSYIKDHIDLLEKVMDVGVKVYVNSTHCDSGQFFGYYEPMGKGTLIICQENRIAGSQEMVTWTEEDLDTLRHESHHLVQDCKGGVRGDKKLVPVFKNEVGVISFARPILGDERMKEIVFKYHTWGAPWEVIVLEFEAFAVAEAIPASDIAAAVEHNCKVR